MSRLPLRGWLLSQAISLTGTRLSSIAIPWFVLTTTGSATRTGVVAAVELAPLVIFKVLGGPLTDRVGGRRVAISCDIASGFVVAGIPFLYAAGSLSFPLLLLLVAVAGALRGPGDGARYAMVPQLVETAGVPLEHATGWGSAIERTASMSGAAAAGALISVLGAATTVYVDAASFLLSALILGVSTRGLARAEMPSEGPTSYLRQLKEGWDFLRHDAVLVGMSGMVAATNLLDLAWSAVLMPVWARSSGHGAGAMGALFAVWSAASTLSALGAARWGARIPRFWTYLIAFLITGLPRFLALGLGAPLWVVTMLFVLGGFASGFLNPILGAVVFERIPKPLLGRVSAINTALCWSLMPLGGLLGGVLASRFGAGPSLVAVGVAYLLATLSPLAVPSFREFDRRPERPEEDRLSAMPQPDVARLDA